MYLTNDQMKQNLLVEGFELHGRTVNVFEFNPYSSGASSPNEKVLKVTVSGVPLSVDDKEIMKMLEKFDIKPKSDMKYENIRNPVTKKMTSVLNGNRFIYIEPLPEGKFLPKVSYCAGLRCNIYHWGQPKHKRNTVCRRCWKDDHATYECKNEETCKVCKQSGHNPGDADCEFYAKKQPNIVPCVGKDNPLSNFFACDLKVFGEKHVSAEHAYQL